MTESHLLTRKFICTLHQNKSKVTELKMALVKSDLYINATENKELIDQQEVSSL